MDPETAVLICEGLLRACEAKAVLLVDREGSEIAHAGEPGDVDYAALAAMADEGGVVTRPAASVGGAAGEHVFACVVAQQAVLAVLFDDISKLGLVKTRVKQASSNLASAQPRRRATFLN